MINKPGRPPPNVTEIRFASTAKEIMPGIDAGLNQLVARIDGELRTNTFPTAATADPNMHSVGSLSLIKVLIQVPITSKAPPIEHPIFMPNLSRIQLAGTVKMGWKMGKNNTLRVTMTES